MSESSVQDAIVNVACPRCHRQVRVPAARIAEGPRCPACKVALFAGAPVELDDRSFDDYVSRNDTPVLVDFWAPWCGPCKAVTKALEELAGETEALEFVKLDIDANPVVASRYEVLSIPTVILFADGAPAETVIGARPAAHFRKTFEPFL
jgi:thioredoxin 2